MLNPDTEILFPIRVISSLRNLRSERWANLIDDLSSREPEDINVVAFSLMMVKMGGCNACNADSFRAMRGCTHCAKLTIRRYKNCDEDLLELYENAREEVKEHLDKLK